MNGVICRSNQPIARFTELLNKPYLRCSWSWRCSAQLGKKCIKGLQIIDPTLAKTLNPLGIAVSGAILKYSSLHLHLCIGASNRWYAGRYSFNTELKESIVIEIARLQARSLQSKVVLKRSAHQARRTILFCSSDWLLSVSFTYRTPFEAAKIRFQTLRGAVPQQ